ncbi:HigA family addiction module antitoxin [Rhizobium sp. 2YAF20]|uniref:HigA family addiction module antitoxin n=1 Tax=Rhizobium sp. 2YAF20 TaxID=3233027 RepID=UPI003F9E880E
MTFRFAGADVELVDYVDNHQEAYMMMKSPAHPGELLRKDILVPLGLLVREAAERLSISRVALSRVLNGRVAISPDLAIRLELAGVGTARFWMGLQAD